MKVTILAGVGGGIQVLGETAQEGAYLEWLGSHSKMSVETTRSHNGQTSLVLSANPLVPGAEKPRP